MIIIPKRYPKVPILFPRVFSQRMAKMIPPLPFHPQVIEQRIPAKAKTQAFFSLLS